MKRPHLFIIAAALTVFSALSVLPLRAQQTGGDRDKPLRRYSISPVVVHGQRHIKNIGIQETRIDTVMLEDNVALSIADVLAFNSSIFVKNWGRATLSTVSFRGTSASHTQVTWNGMRINSPMLGMTDFSVIPSYFIDGASLLHGTSSVNETGGGLGGAVKLYTTPSGQKGFGVQYIQGVGSYKTFDEFLRVGYGNDRWRFSTRAVRQSSANDYKFRNYDKKENIYDDAHNIVGQYYPLERNRNGAFRDFHLLQEVYYDAGAAGRFGLNAWYIDSRRELALLTTEHGDPTAFENLQRENTFRGVLSWDRTRGPWRTALKGGYIHTWVAYDYLRDPGNGIMAVMTRSRSRIDTFYGQLDADYYIGDKWLFTCGLSAYQHLVVSADKNIIDLNGKKKKVGYDEARTELSGIVSVKWRPVERFGMSAVLREDMFGVDMSPVIPALFADWVVSARGNVTAKASVSRNYRFPTLNDLYFQPGGNPDLRKENGWTYDTGLSFAAGTDGVYSLSGSAAWFESYVDDWIIWLPTTKGFFSPRNIKKVHAYGVETQATLSAALGKRGKLTLNGTFSWTPSINMGDPVSPADQSVGKQLPYVPEYSATATGYLQYRTWGLLYKWCYYSRRHTMSSNDLTLTGLLPPYFMSNVTVEKTFRTRRGDLSLKCAVNNLFNEEYLSVLSRPMPGINFEFFIGITPRWGR